MISRDTFANLTKMGSIETFKLRQKRGLIPILDETERRGRGGGFYLVEAWLTIIVNSLHDDGRGMALQPAAETVQAAIPGLRQKFRQIEDASHPGRGDVLVGRVVIPGGEAVPIVGTPYELCEAQVWTGEGIVSASVVSASRSLAVFRRRCDINKIETPDDPWAEVRA